MFLGVHAGVARARICYRDRPDACSRAGFNLAPTVLAVIERHDVGIGILLVVARAANRRRLNALTEAAALLVVGRP